MSWAKSVLPMFTGDSSEKFRIAPDQVQIDTTHFRPQASAKSTLSRMHLVLNRTVVKFPVKFPVLREFEDRGRFANAGALSRRARPRVRRDRDAAALTVAAADGD